MRRGSRLVWAAEAGRSHRAKGCLRALFGGMDMKKEIVFKMERPGLVKEGQVVEVSESVTPFNVNYMIEPAVAMSGLFRLNDRLKADHSVVKKIEENARGYYVTVEFEEEEK